MSASTRKSSRSIRTPGWRAVEGGEVQPRRPTTSNSHSTTTRRRVEVKNTPTAASHTRSSSRTRRAPAVYAEASATSDRDFDTPVRAGPGSATTAAKRRLQDTPSTSTKRTRNSPSSSSSSALSPAKSKAGSTPGDGKSPAATPAKRVRTSAGRSLRATVAQPEAKKQKKGSAGKSSGGIGTVHISPPPSSSLQISALGSKKDGNSKVAAAPASRARSKLAGSRPIPTAAGAGARGKHTEPQGELNIKKKASPPPPLFTASENAGDGPADFMSMLRAAAYTLKTPISTPHGSPKSTRRSPSDKWAGVVLPSGHKMMQLDEDDETPAMEVATSKLGAAAVVAGDATDSPEMNGGGGKKRKFHNLRERQRRFLIRDLFISLRDAIPALAKRESVADREILVEARTQIQKLEEQTRLLQEALEDQRRRRAALLEERAANGYTADDDGESIGGDPSPAPSVSSTGAGVGATSDYGSLSDDSEQTQAAAVASAEAQLAEVLVMLATQ